MYNYRDANGRPIPGPSNQQQTDGLQRRDDFNSDRRRDPYSAPPLLTLTRPDRRYDILDASATPPPLQRRRISTFDARFGDLERPSRTYRDERLQYDPLGPPNPFDRREQTRREARDVFGRQQLPYGGGPPPSDPFRPGGAYYDRQFRRQEDRGPQYSEQEMRRRDFYRNQVGEPWGLAKWQAYEERRKQGL